MKARILAREDVLKIVDLLRQDGYEVMAPFRGRGADTHFDNVSDENREEIVLKHTNSSYPPKRFVFPPIERMLKITRTAGDLSIAQTDGHTIIMPRTARNGGGLCIEPTPREPKRALFAVRSCDIAGIYHLDRFFLGRDFRDNYYAARRKHLFLVNLVCTDPATEIGENCFCMCTDTGPAARDHFDLQLMDLGDEYMAVAGTATGEALFSHENIFKKAATSHVLKRRAILAETRKHFKQTTSWFAATVRYVSQEKILEQTWEQIGNRCLECGGCTYVCPACTCFTVTDRQVAADEIERVRTWDSCALGGFTRMAGGFNPRRAVHDRRNRRFFRKLAQYFIQRELSMACVGCGRCATVCHGDVGMPAVVEMIRRATAAVEATSPQPAAGPVRTS